MNNCCQKKSILSALVCVCVCICAELYCTTELGLYFIQFVTLNYLTSLLRTLFLSINKSRLFWEEGSICEFVKPRGYVMVTMSPVSQWLHTALFLSSSCSVASISRRALSTTVPQGPQWTGSIWAQASWDAQTGKRTLSEHQVQKAPLRRSIFTFTHISLAKASRMAAPTFRGRRED